MIVLGLVAALLVSGVAILAQQETSFTDKRINGDINLGGLAIYCVDQFGQPGAPNVNDGGITVWGVGGRKYADLTADELRGLQRVTGGQNAASQAGTTGSTAQTTTSVQTALGLPLLLVQADATNGRLWLFRTGEDQFVLQSTDTTGKFFSYQWSGCDQGSISTGGGPLMAVQPTVATPLEGVTGAGQATAQPTQAATTVPSEPTAVPTYGA